MSPVQPLGGFASERILSYARYLGWTGSQNHQSAAKAELSRLMETHIWCLPGPAGCVRGGLSKGTMAPSGTLVQRRGIPTTAGCENSTDSVWVR